MEAIDSRLRQLEDVEARLCSERHLIVQQRSREDEGYRLKRRSEDEEFFRILKDRDQEEDVRLSNYSRSTRGLTLCSRSCASNGGY